MKKFALLFLVFVSTSLFAQQNITFHCVDSTTNQSIEKATITINGKTATTTNSKGFATTTLNNGNHTINISCVGFALKSFNIHVPAATAIIDVVLINQQKNLDDIVVVSSTRNNQKIENAPIKVEVLGKEEMQEESSIKPGGIASILGDISGVQIQQSSATSGNTNVRIQGLDGRYTQILKDGMPLFDGFSGGFGVLSVPPLDLKQVELIKGSASTLYGGGAIGGLINIISKKPVATPENTIILNQTTLKETNANAFFSRKFRGFGYTFFSGYTHQKQIDVNSDGFSDLPLLKSFVAHPRLFFYVSNKATITAGYTATIEERSGGDMFVLDNKIDATHQFFEANKTNRHSVELGFEQHLTKGKKFELKSNISSFNRIIETNNIYFKGSQTNYFAEASLFIPNKKSSTVMGINYLGDAFKKDHTSSNMPLENFSNTTIGFFAQHTLRIEDKTTIDMGLRNDYHTSYGNKILPRIALFHRFSEHWATRAGIGLGYKIPNALSPQNADISINLIAPIDRNVASEKSIGYNAEVNYKKEWSEETEIFINVAFFLTKIKDPIIASENIIDYVRFYNAAKPITTKGFDVYVKGKLDDWEIYLGYTFTSALRKYLTTNQFIPLTPKHRMAFTLVKEFEPNWRIGLEGSFSGSQYRNNATKTPSYFFAAAMIERKFGKNVSIVLNGENLFNYRQSNVEPLFTGSVSNPVFQPLWAPIDGRVINLSMKIKW